MATRVRDLKQGALIIALRHLEDVDIAKGSRGIIVEAASGHESKAGPVALWLNGGTCNVDEGDVAPDALVLATAKHAHFGA